MSIAVTVVVRPSRCLRLLAGGFGVSMLAVALAIFSLSSLRFTAGPVVSLALLFAGLCLVHAALHSATVHRIDISGLGRIRLTVQQDVRPDAAGGRPVLLLPGSTLWPRLMLLRFGPADGDDVARGRLARWRAGRCVVVFPDSVAPDAFRALAVALGAVAGRAARQ